MLSCGRHKDHLEESTIKWVQLKTTFRLWRRVALLGQSRRAHTAQGSADVRAEVNSGLVLFSWVFLVLFDLKRSTCGRSIVALALHAC